MKAFCITILISILLFSCGSEKKQESADAVEPKSAGNRVELTKEQIQQAELTTGSPEFKVINQSIRLKGVMEAPPKNIVSVSIPLGGYIKQMNLLSGMQVKKGAELCRIEDQQYIQLQQDYLVGKSRLGYLQEDYNRQASLNETQSVSNKVFQQVRSDYQSQRAIVRGLEEKLRLIGIEPAALNDENISRSIVIRAPISGYISAVNVNTGQFVGPTDVLFQIINPSDIHLSLTAFENDIEKLKQGQKVVAYSNGDPSKKYNGRIVLINRSIDQERAGEVHCDLELPDNKLTPGLFMNADIELGDQQSAAVPDDALVKWENKYYVFQVESANQFAMTPVEVGVSKDGYTAIKNDLQGKSIVTKGAYSLLMKLKNTAEE